MKTKASGNIVVHRSYGVIGAISLMLILFTYTPTALAQTPGGFDGPPQMDGPPFDGPGMQGPGQGWRQNRRARNGQRGNFHQQMRKGGKGNPLVKMARFLEFANKYHQSIKEPHDAFGLAIMGIVEHYKKSQAPEKAVAELKGLLSKTTDPQARNIILFQLRNLYQDGRQKEEVLKISKQIAEENLRIIQSAK